MTLNKNSFENIVGKKRKCWKPAFSPFPTMFSILRYINFKFSITFILLSANAFNLGWSKILSFGKELNPYQTNPCFYMSAVQVFLEQCGKRRNCLSRAISPFSLRVFYPHGKLSVIFIKFKLVVCKTIFIKFKIVVCKTIFIKFKCVVCKTIFIKFKYVVCKNIFIKFKFFVSV